MVKKYLSGVAYFCETPKHTFALGFGMGLIGIFFVMNSRLQYGLFLILALIPVACAVTHLQGTGRIPRNSFWVLFAGAVVGSTLFAEVFIISLFLQ